MADDTTTIQTPEQPVTPNPALRSLDRLIGTWNLSDPQGKDEMRGQVKFEWMDGGFFLQQHVDMVQGGQPTKGLEIIGFDEESQTIKSHYFGNDAHIFEYTWECNEETLTIWFGDVGSAGKYTGTFSADGNTNSGGWEWPGGGYASMMTRAKDS